MNPDIVICKIDSQWEFLYDAGSSNSVLCDNQTRGGFGGRVQEGGNVFALMADCCCCMAKTNPIL